MVGPVVVPGTPLLSPGQLNLAPLFCILVPFSFLPDVIPLEVCMRLNVLLMVMLVFAVLSADGQTTFPGYFSSSDLSAASPGAFRFGMYGFDNPALLTSLRQPDAMFSWTDHAAGRGDLTRWGLFSAVPNFGFGMVRTTGGGISVTDYRLALGFGDRSFAGGVSYGWSSGDRDALNRSNVWSVGFLVRPDRHVSVGLVGSTATADNSKEAVVDLAVRPLGTELVTVFGDYALAKGVTLRNGNWSAGAVIEPLPGIRVIGRYFDSHAFSVGLDLSLGYLGGSARTAYDSDSKRMFNTYAVRLGAYDRTVLQKLSRNERYMKLNMFGPVKYQTYRWFDDGTTLADILEQIEAARTDETVAGIAINTSGMEAGRSMLWEIRQKLEEFRSSGKKVVVFIDRAGIQEYHFASVADKIVMDPTGALVMEGYLMGRTFLKGTLEKLGIGYDEWRFFKYKSAAESFSRDSMSAADREQRQALVDNFYAQAKEEICRNRHLTPARFDSVVNDGYFLSPQDALAAGMVDTLGRWEEVASLVQNVEGDKKAMVGASTLEHFNKPYDDRWGEPSRIAVIYALGACDMDEGIKARSLVKDVESAVNDTRVKGIVLRVDSPGGDGMASDYIAEALRKARGKKPVIVSQGTVAASGGYWLSMYADTIVANPTTITGSIGVIGGWMYNKELKQKLGMSTDHVKVGNHADLGFGFTLPLLGIGLPDRNFSAEERGKAERWIKRAYDEFVQKVATGREMTPAQVDSVGQGRVWSGTDGKRLGLVDVLGGLETAVNIARITAGSGKDEGTTVIELPRPGLFNLSRLIPSPFPASIVQESDPWMEHLIFRLKHNGVPMPVMPLEEWEAVAR
jgi:protease IV